VWLTPECELDTDGRAAPVEATDPLSDAAVDAMLASIRRLETLADARELLTPLAE
jgi:hypothetical protein